MDKVDLFLNIKLNIDKYKTYVLKEILTWCLWYIVNK